MTITSFGPNLFRWFTVPLQDSAKDYMTNFSAAAWNCAQNSVAASQRVWNRAKDSIAASQRWVQEQPLYQRGGQYKRYKLSPSDPKDLFKTITQTAEKGLRNASAVGAAPSSVAPLHAEIDRSLASLPPPPPSAVEAPALTSSTRGQERDWQREIELRRTELAKKLTDLSTLVEMRNRCGINESDDLALINLVKKKWENPQSSLWSLFTAHYQPKFFQKIRAGWFYCFYYLTSLVSNVVETYLYAFIDQVTKDLTQKESPTRNLLFRKILEQTNQFLIADAKATRAFAYGQEDGDLKQCRERAIQKVYGFSLKGLCKAFSEKLVKQHSPIVPLLRDFQQIPLIGRIFKAFEWCINRFIIQNYMKSSILPETVENAIVQGVEATGPGKLPFLVGITRSLISGFEQFQEELVANNGHVRSNPSFSDPQLLHATVKNLSRVLELEGEQTPQGLRARFENLEKDTWVKRWLARIDRFDPDEGIEEGVIDAANGAIHYLNEKAISGQLFADALTLSCAPFSGQEDHKALLSQYNADQLKLKRIADECLRKIVNDAVSRKINGPTHPVDSKKNGEHSFKNMQVVAQKTVEKLTDLSAGMVVKANQLVPANSHVDIASFFEATKVLADRKEMQGAEGVNPPDQNEIHRRFIPIYEQTKEIQKDLLDLQDSQRYHSIAAVQQQLELIRDLLASFLNELRTSPTHPQEPLIQNLRSAVSEIRKCPGGETGIVTRLQALTVQLTELSRNIAEGEKGIGAIHALYPPRSPGETPATQGLIETLLDYYQGRPYPRNFKPRTCLAAIRAHLRSFPAEQAEVESLIGNGSQLNTNWSRLGRVLQRIYQKYSDLRSQNSLRLNALIDQESQWVQGQIADCTQRKAEDHIKMKIKAQAIQEKTNALRDNVNQAQLTLPNVLTSTEKTWAVRGFTAFGGAVGALVGPAGTLVGTAIARGLGAFWSAEPEIPLVERIKKLPFLVGAGTTALSALYSYYPSMVFLGWQLGLQGKKELRSWGEDRAHKRTMELFNKTYDLGKSERVYNGALTRTVKELAGV